MADSLSQVAPPNMPSPVAGQISASAMHILSLKIKHMMACAPAQEHALTNMWLQFQHIKPHKDTKQTGTHAKQRPFKAIKAVLLEYIMDTERTVEHESKQWVSWG